MAQAGASISLEHSAAPRAIMAAMPNRLWTRVGALAVDCRIEGLDATAAAAFCNAFAAMVGERSPYRVSRSDPSLTDVRIRLEGAVADDAGAQTVVARLWASRPAIEGETEERTQVVPLRLAMTRDALSLPEHRPQITAALARILPWRRTRDQSPVQSVRQSP